jgi:carboxyl-terminal processing protease
MLTVRHADRARLARAALAALVALSLFGCAPDGGGARGGSSASARDAEDLSLIRDAMGLVHDRYVRDVPDKELVDESLKGMISGLDPHSAYMDPKEYRDFTSNTRGEFGGIGAELTRDGGRVKVIAPIEDTPAARAGIRPGDIIERVNGKAVDGLDLNDVVERIRGPSGTQVKLTLGRGTASSFDVDLTREVIRVNAVKSALFPGRIGYARVTVFNEHAQERLLDAIERLKREAGGQLAGFVLDLRNDPGGLLDQAVAIAGDFVDGGAIVSTRGRDGKVTRRYTAPRSGDRLGGVPMVAMINGASASASEIVAGALQDYKRATIMGTRSFGKGSVQTVIPLSGRGAVRLTTDLYYTPSGRSIQGHGVVPDIALPLPKDEQVAGARTTREADLKNAIRPPAAPGAAATKVEKSDEAVDPGVPASEDGIVDPLVIGTERDRQLQEALAALRSGKVTRAASR